MQNGFMTDLCPARGRRWAGFLGMESPPGAVLWSIRHFVKHSAYRQFAASDATIFGIHNLPRRDAADDAFIVPMAPAQGWIGWMG